MGGGINKGYLHGSNLRPLSLKSKIFLLIQHDGIAFLFSWKLLENDFDVLNTRINNKLIIADVERIFLNSIHQKIVMHYSSMGYI